MSRCKCTVSQFATRKAWRTRFATGTHDTHQAPEADGTPNALWLIDYEPTLKAALGLLDAPRALTTDKRRKPGLRQPSQCLNQRCLI